jgi:LPS export ABC transporter protein LptC
LRNQEAARYARWAAITAVAITLLVAGFYAERAVRAYIARRHGPPPVPVSVSEQSADFNYSQSGPEGRTIFTIRASHATQFNNEDRALLQDVWVTIYGRQGDRNDNIHTRECSYQPVGGSIQCAGDVEIDIQAATAAKGKPASQPLQVKTSNLTFNRKTGQATTPAPVDLNFAGGKGHGTGLSYDSNQSVLRLERGVDFEMAASDRTGGLPVNATAANLEFHRDERTVELGGPVLMRQGDRELSAERVSIGLDGEYHAQTISAEGNPVIRGVENGATFTVSAQKFTGSLDVAGTLQQLAADGGVKGERKTLAGNDHFSAARVDFAMVPGRNLVRDMTATGSVSAESRAGANVRTLKTDALKMTFATLAPSEPRGRNAGQDPGANVDKQHIEAAETLGPATIESKTSADTVDLKAAKFAAQFAPDGKLEKLLGHSGVQITRVPAGDGPAQTSDAAELIATFGPGGDWATMDETGNVRLAQAVTKATAGHARIVRATDAITLDGSPVFSDAASRTSAGSVAINQKTGDIRAAGGVVSTELAPSATGGKSSANQIALGEGQAHISGDTLTGSTTSGDVTFRGHARLWQGQAVLQADQIGVSRDSGKLDATGHVVAVFPQDAGLGPQLPAFSAAKTKQTNAPSGPVIWQVRAQHLTYMNDRGVAHLEGGVTASSDQGSLQSKTLDVYLAAATASANPTPSASAFGGRGLERAVAQGDVVVSQAGAHGDAEQADYDAKQGKFVLSGGEPTITDGNGNTTTGRSLTFYVASDTISIDSSEGSRTLTRHRVEK